MIEIRRTQTKDAPALKAMLHRVWHQTYAPFLGADRVDHLTEMWHSAKKHAQEVDDETCATFVAFDGEKLVGHALIADEGDGHVHLKRLYLDYDYHGQGVGRQLLQMALTAFPNSTLASLEVYEDNHRAVAFYQQQGFIISEKLRDEFADDELYEYCMHKRLDAATH